MSINKAFVLGLVPGAAYVGWMDDLAVFNRSISEAEVHSLFKLKKSAAELSD